MLSDMSFTPFLFMPHNQKQSSQALPTPCKDASHDMVAPRHSFRCLEKQKWGIQHKDLPYATNPQRWSWNKYLHDASFEHSTKSFRFVALRVRIMADWFTLPSLTWCLSLIKFIISMTKKIFYVHQVWHTQMHPLPILIVQSPKQAELRSFNAVFITSNMFRCFNAALITSTIFHASFFLMSRPQSHPLWVIETV